MVFSTNIVIQYSAICVTVSDGKDEVKWLVAAALVLSMMGWTMVVSCDVFRDYYNHFTGAFLFSIGYVVMFPVLVVIYGNGSIVALWMLYAVAVVCDIGFAAGLLLKNRQVAYWSEWTSFVCYTVSIYIHLYWLLGW